VAKEAELDEKEAEYIRQVNTKEIDEAQFQELVGELDLERVIGESVAEGPATMQAMTQDEEVGESERDESAEKVIESSTVGKGKWKVVPARAKVYGEVDGPVSRLPKSTSICTNTVQPMLYAEDTAKVHHYTIRAVLQEVPN
jgi:hypothetical protein